MRLRNLTFRGLDALETGHRLEIEKNLAEARIREVLYPKFEYALSQLYEEQAKVDENGAMIGNPSVYQEQVYVLQNEISTEQSKINSCNAELEVNVIEKRQIIKEIEKANQGKEPMLEKLNALSGKRFGLNSQSAALEISERMNQAEDVREMLAHSLGESVSEKTYSIFNNGWSGRENREIMELCPATSMEDGMEAYENQTGKAFLNPVVLSNVNHSMNEKQYTKVVKKVIQTYKKYEDDIMIHVNEQMQNPNLNWEEKGEILHQTESALAELKFNSICENRTVLMRMEVEERECANKEQKLILEFISDLNLNMERITNRNHRILAQQNKTLRKTSECVSDGRIKGNWSDDIFYFSDDYIPGDKRFNPDGKNIGEIRQELKEYYNITMGGIPFKDGELDLSGMAVIQISYGNMKSAIYENISDKEKQNIEQEKELLHKCAGESGRGGKDLDDIEKNLADMKIMFNRNRREKNFSIADELVAERNRKYKAYRQENLPPPLRELEEACTKADVEKWRKKYKFTWHEQLNGGYLLVPSVIHRQFAHFGLVGVAENAASHYKEI